MNAPKSVSAAPQESCKPIAAGKFIQKLADEIMSKHRSLLGAVIALRLIPQKYEDISEATAPLFTSVNREITPAIRLGVIALLCQRVIDSDIHDGIKSSTRSSREDLNHYPWTPALDDELLGLEQSCRQTSGKHRGSADWQAVALHMKNNHDILLSERQWMRRAYLLRLKRKILSKKVDRSSSDPAALIVTTPAARSNEVIDGGTDVLHSREPEDRDERPGERETTQQHADAVETVA